MGKLQKNIKRELKIERQTEIFLHENRIPADQKLKKL